MIDFLDENFKMRFSDFHNSTTHICIIENPFSISVTGAQEKLQLGLIELQYGLILCSDFN
jgi:hypothetical protein